LPRASGSARTLDQVLRGGMMGSEVRSINGKRYPDTDPIVARRRDLVQLRLRNQSMEVHPMHLHRQSFRVLAVNGGRLAAPLVKDAVDVAGAHGRGRDRVHRAQPGGTGSSTATGRCTWRAG